MADIPSIDRAAMAAAISASLAGTPIPSGDTTQPPAALGDPDADGGGAGVAPSPTPAAAPAPDTQPPDLAALSAEAPRIIGSPDPEFNPFDGVVPDPRTPPVAPEVPGAAAAPVPDPAAVAPDASAAPPAPDPAAPDPDAPAPFDPARVFELVLGHEPTPDEVVQTVSLASRVASLSPEQQQWVDGILTGRIDPRAIEQRLAAPPTPTPAPAPADPYADPYDTTPTPDPGLEAERQRLAQERAALDAQRAEWEQHRVNQAQTEARRALAEFRSAHSDWAPEELAALEARVQQSPVWGGIYASTGDAHAATAQTIQLEALNHPHFREKLMGPAATSPDPTADDAARATAAAALAGNGGGAGGPVGPSVPPTPGDPRLTQTQVPAGYTAPPVQLPVQPAASPYTNQPEAPDLTNRNVMAMEMARQIAAMRSGG